ncbi:hypothetical protein DPMN_036354 [Dreissena polymorpha]|uniref:Uncharacterized protein n=1 Tax=Dreissena polymorpha TaxID=45954 RepID=A0A9D4MAJ7_DREPO|nr:hypothetical protein DPMN_036354 [Dreissena polymorpha]
MNFHTQSLTQNAGYRNLNTNDSEDCSASPTRSTGPTSMYGKCLRYLLAHKIPYWQPYKQKLALFEHFTRPNHYDEILRF